MTARHPHPETPVFDRIRQLRELLAALKQLASAVTPAAQKEIAAALQALLARDYARALHHISLALAAALAPTDVTPIALATAPGLTAATAEAFKLAEAALQKEEQAAAAQTPPPADQPPEEQPAAEQPEAEGPPAEGQGGEPEEGAAPQPAQLTPDQWLTAISLLVPLVLKLFELVRKNK